MKERNGLKNTKNVIGMRSNATPHNSGAQIAQSELCGVCPKLIQTKSGLSGLKKKTNLRQGALQGSLQGLFLNVDACIGE